MYLRLIATLAMTALLVGCSKPTADPATEAGDAFARYVEAINKGDTEAVAAMYDSNAGFHWIEQGGVRYATGNEAGTAFAELARSGSRAQMTTDEMQVAILSDTSALISSHFEFSLLDASGVEQFAFDGWMTVGLAKRENGWKIAGGQTGPGRQQEQETAQ